MEKYAPGAGDGISLNAMESESPFDAAQIWHVYLLECADGTLYCGVTTDIARRLAQHNGQLSGGAKYTRPRRPVRMVASWECAGGRSAAQRLEDRLRRLPRARKVAALLALPGGELADVLKHGAFQV